MFDQTKWDESKASALAAMEASSDPADRAYAKFLRMSQIEEWLAKELSSDTDNIGQLIHILVRQFVSNIHNLARAVKNSDELTAIVAGLVMVNLSEFSNNIRMIDAADADHGDHGVEFEGEFAGKGRKVVH